MTALMNKIGTWKFTVVGGILMCGGSLTTAFATEFWHVIISHGVLQGLAARIIQLCAMDIIGIYFDTRQYNIHSLLVAARLTGTAIGPVFTAYLIDTTSYKHALLIEACLYLLIFPCALIFRGPAGIRRSTPNLNNSNTGEVNANYQQDLADRTEVMSVTADIQIQKQIEAPTAEDEDKKVPKHDGKLDTTNNHSYVLKQPIFILFLVVVFLVAITVNTFFVVAVDYTVNAGVFTLNQAALAMTLLGTCAGAGSIFVTFISHCNLDINFLMIISAFLLGLTICLMPLANASFAAMFVVLMLFGLFQGVYEVGRLLWLVGQLNKPHLMILRFAYQLFVVGVATVIGPLMAGYFAKAFSPVAMLCLLGSFPMIAAILIVPYWIKVKRNGNVPLLKSVNDTCSAKSDADAATDI